MLVLPPKSLRQRLLVLGVVLLVTGCEPAESSRQPGGPPPPAVEVASVERGMVQDALELVGQLEADESVMLRPEVAGVVAAVEFVEGQEVKAGATLFRLRDEEQRARLAEARAQIVLAEQVHQRASTLAGEGVLSASELDRAISERNAARARAELAQVALDRTRIHAPFDGVLGARLVSPGDRIAPETSLVQIDATARLKLAFTVPERTVPLLRTGLSVQVRVASFPERRFPGEVFFVAPVVSPQNRRLLAKAYLANPERLLKPGMFATIDLETTARIEALLVPESAIAYDATGPYVWRLDPENVAQRVPVSLGTRREGRIEVVRGLATGERIVASGTHKVTQGQPVVIAGSEGARPGSGRAQAPGAEGGPAAGSTAPTGR